MSSNNRSKKTIAVYRCILKSQREFGWSPSIAEIQRETSLSPKIVRLSLKALEADNILRIGTQARQISIRPKEEWNIKL